MKILIRNRTFALILIMVLLFSFFAGCQVRNFEWCNVKDTLYKNNVNGAYGQFATGYKDRIYYISNDNDKDGVYSMDSGGEDIRIEFEFNKIIKLIVTDEKIYFIGFEDIGKRKQEIYSFYEFDRESKVISVIRGDVENESVENALITGSEIFLRVIESLNSSQAPNSFTYDILDKKNECLISTNLEGLDNEHEYEISIYENYIITSVKYLYSMNSNLESGKYDTNTSVYSISTGESLMWRHLEAENNNFKVIYTDDNNIYLSYMNQLIVYDRDTIELKEIISFAGISDYEQIDYLIKSEESMVLIFNSNKDNIRLFSLDKDTFKYNEIKSFNDETVLINVQNGGILFADDNQIIFQSMSVDGLEEVEYIIDFDEDIVDNNVFEVATNWLFIYSKGKKSDTSSFELLYRVNLETEEIIEH